MVYCALGYLKHSIDSILRHRFVFPLRVVIITVEILSFTTANIRKKIIYFYNENNFFFFLRENTLFILSSKENCVYFHLKGF